MFQRGLIGDVQDIDQSVPAERAKQSPIITEEEEIAGEEGDDRSYLSSLGCVVFPDDLREIIGEALLVEFSGRRFLLPWLRVQAPPSGVGLGRERRIKFPETGRIILGLGC
jgi:hypothetical protein